MDPFTFLREECDSVREALKETLRYDYGPQRSLDYYNECKTRLDTIGEAIVDEPTMDGATIAAHMRSLGALGSRISLIERSHLGEFSWPFAEVIREFAEKVFREKQLDDKIYPPIVHVIAEGMQYQIVDDAVPPIGKRRIVVVAFPRQLKHQVLLHSIFGHELGHTAFNSNDTGNIIRTQVMPALISSGPLMDQIQATAWLKHAEAPPSVVSALRNKKDYVFPETSLTNWRTEIICDLFGLLLFGPAFAAAHRTILSPLSASPSDFDLNNSTHPPYSIRRHVIAAAMNVLGWNNPVTLPEDGAIHDAEKALLDYTCKDTIDAWSALLVDSKQIKTVLDRLAKIFEPHPTMAFKQPDRALVIELINRLTLGRPPIMQNIDVAGVATNRAVLTCHCLYAGWSFWFGHKEIRDAMLSKVKRLPELTFLQINQLCDYAILQQHAIDTVQRAKK